MNLSLKPVIIPVLFGLLLGACGSSSSKSSDAGADRVSSGGTGGSGTGGPRICGSGPGNTCTAAERMTYETCVTNACNATYTDCLGPGYKTGTYTGVCGTYFSCVNACPCENNIACLLACGLPDPACQACALQLETCSGMCTEPACYSTPGGTGGRGGGSTGGSTGSSTGGRSGGATGGSTGSSTGGRAGGATGGSTGSSTGGASGTATCADVVACCNRVAIPALKDGCLQAIMGASEAECAQALPALKMTFCP